MPSAGAPTLLHVGGYLTGGLLFAMLLAMVVRSRGPAYRLMLSTALFGMAWNIGELSVHALDGVHLTAARDWMAAVSYTALGFLAAVVVHSAGRDQVARRTRLFVVGAYVCAGVAGMMHLLAAATHAPLPSGAGLILLTVAIAVLSIALFVTTAPQPQGRRVGWTAALALFAISALHLVRFHGASEGWTTELLGHHASIPLAFAILYQDYRFAFADLFLKRALTLICLVTIVFAAWSVVEPSLSAAPDSPVAIGILLAAWIGTALLFPIVHRYASMFVDRVVLKRADYRELVDDIAQAIQASDSESAVLATVCRAIAPALNASSVTWHADVPGASASTIAIVTTEAPRHALAIGQLTGGRRLLSDDVMMLERVAVLAARRIDALRLSDERYERMLREREISTLATEAELRALRAQTNPHFLFNALTTLGYLIQNAPDRALNTLMRLTTLLRSVLRSEGEFTTLGHERELVECYLDIERERFEERLRTTVDIPEALDSLPIPALIIQPLVENAIKHGIAHALHGGRVHVAARIHEDDASLRITVRNSGAPLQRRRGHGIGLENVERRLRCYYGDAARLTVAQDGTGDTLAELVLPVGDLATDHDEAVVARARS